MLLKLVDELPSETFPIQSPKRTGSMTGLSIYQAMGFLSVLVSGMEMSIGFDRLTSKVWSFVVIVACTRFVLCRKDSKPRSF